VLVPRYKLSLCHTPVKPDDLLGFLGIGVFVCGLRDHVITRFTSFGISSLYELNQYIKPYHKLLKLYILSIWVDIALYLKF